MMQGLMKKLAKSLRKHEAGFTLMELLVVVGIIVALVAVIVPNVIQFSNRGETGAQAAETDGVQAAMDAMMADQSITLVTSIVGSSSVQNWAALPAGTGAQPLNTYLRSSTTTYFYCYDGTGLVSIDTTGTATC